MQIRVLLADDQQLMREGLRVLLHLTPDIRVVGEAGDGVEAATCCFTARWVRNFSISAAPISSGCRTEWNRMKRLIQPT